MLERINRQLDHFAHASFKAGRRSVSPFHFWSATGLGLAIMITLSFAVHRGLMLLLVAVNLLAAFALGLFVKVVTGSERHTHYHYEIVIAAVTIFTLKSMGQPVVPYLDAMVIGKGLLLSTGRLGCFMAGCCHGRPFCLGVCYPYAQTGVGRHYVGVRLFPVQLLEALIASVLTVLCASLLLRDARPGTALTTYVIGYGTARFFIELLRGDPQRPYLGGYSEAQWTSLLLMSFVVWLEYFSVLPFHTSHVVVVGGVLAVMLVITVKRSQTAHRFLQPRHLAEVAAAFELVSKTASKEILSARTSQGVQVSASRLRSATTRIDHYSLSQRDGELTEKAARTLLQLAVRLRPESAETKLITSDHRVFHLLVYDRSASSTV